MTAPTMRKHSRKVTIGSWKSKNRRSRSICLTQNKKEGKANFGLSFFDRRREEGVIREAKWKEKSTSQNVDSRTGRC